MGQLPPPQFGMFVDNTFGQRVNIIRAKHNTCSNNTNLGSVTAVTGNNSATTPPPNRERKMSATTPPPTESIRAKLGLPPPNGCWPVRLWQYESRWNSYREASRQNNRHVLQSNTIIIIIMFIMDPVGPMMQCNIVKTKVSPLCAAMQCRSRRGSQGLCIIILRHTPKAKPKN